MLAQWPDIMQSQNNRQSSPSLSYAEHSGIDYSSGVPSRLQRLQGYGEDLDFNANLQPQGNDPYYSYPMRDLDFQGLGADNVFTIPLPETLARDVMVFALGFGLGYLIFRK